jgi:hypothetical protein
MRAADGLSPEARQGPRGSRAVAAMRSDWMAWHVACVQVRTASCGGTACLNSFGDEQLAVDVLADKLLFEALKYSVRDHHQQHQLLRLPVSACNQAWLC